MNEFTFTHFQGFNNQKIIRKYPTEAGVLLLNVVPFESQELILIEGKSLVNFSRKNRIGGGTIGCDIDTLYKWHKKYYSTLEGYRDHGRFLGKDQNVMATACIESEMCLLVPSNINSWFKLQDYLIGNLVNDKMFRLKHRP